MKSLLHLVLKDFENTKQLLQGVLGNPEIGYAMKTAVENRLKQMDSVAALVKEAIENPMLVGFPAGDQEGLDPEYREE